MKFSDRILTKHAHIEDLGFDSEICKTNDMQRSSLVLPRVDCNLAKAAGGGAAFLRRAEEVGFQLLFLGWGLEVQQPMEHRPWPEPESWQWLISLSGHNEEYRGTKEWPHKGLKRTEGNIMSCVRGLELGEGDSRYLQVLFCSIFVLATVSWYPLKNIPKEEISIYLVWYSKSGVLQTECVSIYFFKTLRPLREQILKAEEEVKDNVPTAVWWRVQGVVKGAG